MDAGKIGNIEIKGEEGGAAAAEGRLVFQGGAIGQIGETESFVYSRVAYFRESTKIIAIVASGKIGNIETKGQKGGAAAAERLFAFQGGAIGKILWQDSFLHSRVAYF